jgi:hypothetical protein
MKEPPATISRPITIRTNDLRYVYGVYGIALHSTIPLPLPCLEHGELARIELRTANASFFDDAMRYLHLEQRSGSWYEFGRLRDGSSYARWRGVGEFLVSSDGRRIFCRQFDQATIESFHVYLLGQALSFALVKSGFEPLHATVVVVNGDALAFLGDTGFGKSSLAACFLDAGHQMLTDDLLLLQPGTKDVLAYPGPPRIKLYPKMADRFFPDAPARVRMNPETAKLIVPLDRKRSCSRPVPVNAVYCLAGPREVFRKQKIRFEPLSPRQAFLELVKNTFNRRIMDADRLQRQLDETARLVSILPIGKLSFPRDWSRLPSVRDTIISSLRAPAVECRHAAT